MAKLTSQQQRVRRHHRVRRKVAGTTVRPRLAVYRSEEHIYAQIIDDTTRRTLTAASTLEPAIRDEVTGKTKVAQARLVGALIGERARALGIDKVVFDRGGFLYHGRVQELANAARESGLQF
ncbi:MAG TPA: 50S ribosomal protein L18 [Chloroflexota bacterium]|nr:50S ribosomal protein L18 [Chloroflexota bacterium]